MTKRASPATTSAMKPLRGQTTHGIELVLPVKMAAQLAALHEMHKEKSLHQIAEDLIKLGLAQIEAAAGTRTMRAQAPQMPQHQPVYLLSGPFAEFEHLVVKHHLRMERELAGEDTEIKTTSDPYDLNNENA